MTILNKNTKKARYYSNCFRRAIDNSSIFDIYAVPSKAKIIVAGDIERKARELKCYDIRYLHGNSFNFAMGYSDGKVLYIETASNTYKIEL